MMDGYSIIIPTYDNVEFIEECLQSIKTAFARYKYEILLGIDDCERTMSRIDMLRKYTTRIYKSKENVGPYVIKNSLSQIAEGSHLVFFDSDDIMDKSFGQLLASQVSNKYIRFPYKNFRPADGIRWKSGIKLYDCALEYAEGVFSIDKQLFYELGGFKPWRCAADTEFLQRTNGLEIGFNIMKNIAFYRRIHDKNLTISPKTGLKSDLRKEYTEQINMMIEAKDFKCKDLSTIEMVMQ